MFLSNTYVEITLITAHIWWWFGDIRKGKQRIKTNSFPNEKQSKLGGTGLQPAETGIATLLLSDLWGVRGMSLERTPLPLPTSLGFLLKFCSED